MIDFLVEKEEDAFNFSTHNKKFNKSVDKKIIECYINKVAFLRER